MEQPVKNEGVRTGVRRLIPHLGRRREPHPITEPERKVPFTEYLHILETYAVKWDTEKVARDTMQNFFDANGYSLDLVKTETSQTEEGSKVRITGPANYDYRYLLHTGGTTKEDDIRAAGGFGEGAKIAAFICLRDLGAKQVIYETGGKKVTFYLDTITDSLYPRPIKGLFARVEESKIQGSSFEVEFPFKDLATPFEKARDLFYHKDNPDFQDSTVNNEVGGFKIHIGTGGNLYESGQRRHLHSYDNSLVWNNADDVTIWTWNKTFKTDRDRGDVDKYQIEEKAIKQIVSAMDLDQIRDVIVDNPEFWHKTNGLGIGRSLLHELASQYKKKKGEPLTFPPKYIARSVFTPTYIDQALEGQGYIICDFSLGDIGMTTSSEKFSKLQEHFRTEPNEAEAQRIGLLKKAVKELVDVDLEEEIYMFSQKDEKNIIHGQYGTGVIWMAQEQIRGNFARALATLLHEKDHKAGSDQSAEFSYALTDTLEKVIGAFLRKADVAKPLADSWESVKFE